MLLENPERWIATCQPLKLEIRYFSAHLCWCHWQGAATLPTLCWVLVTAAVTRQENPELWTAGSRNFWVFSRICTSTVGAGFCVTPAQFQPSLCVCSNDIYRGHSSEQAPLVPGARETKTAQNPCPGNFEPELKNTDEKQNPKKPNPRDVVWPRWWSEGRGSVWAFIKSYFKAFDAKLSLFFPAGAPRSWARGQGCCGGHSGLHGHRVIHVLTLPRNCTGQEWSCKVLSTFPGSLPSCQWIPQSLPCPEHWAQSSTKITGVTLAKVFLTMCLRYHVTWYSFQNLIHQ